MAARTCAGPGPEGANHLELRAPHVVQEAPVGGGSSEAEARMAVPADNVDCMSTSTPGGSNAKRRKRARGGVREVCERAEGKCERA
eukprot:851937-Rhodomonas_salina.1